jgi:hypothetical protein
MRQLALREIATQALGLKLLPQVNKDGFGAGERISKGSFMSHCVLYLLDVAQL